MKPIILQQNRELFNLTAIIEESNYQYTQTAIDQREIDCQALELDTLWSQPVQDPHLHLQLLTASRTEMSDKMQDPVEYAGGIKNLKHIVIQFRIKLGRNSDLFDNLHIATMYAISHLEEMPLSKLKPTSPTIMASS